MANKLVIPVVVALFAFGLNFWAWTFVTPLLSWTVGVFYHAAWTTRNLRIARLAVLAGFVQLSGYGKGLLLEFVTVRVLQRRDSTIGNIRNVPLP